MLARTVVEITSNTFAHSVRRRTKHAGERGVTPSLELLPQNLRVLVGTNTIRGQGGAE